MRNVPIQGVVFDVDGVLFDTERLMHTVWLEVGAEMGWPQVGEDYLEFVGQNRTDIYAKMLRFYGPTFEKEVFLPACSQRLQDRLERDGVPLKPGAMELISFLHQRRIPIAIATSTAAVRTRRRMEMTGLDQFLQAMVTGDQVTHGKPDPEIYRLACQALGTDPACTVAVEDSRNGILSAHAAGMPTVMVPDMIAPTPELEQLLWKRCDSLSQLHTELAHIL